MRLRAEQAFKPAPAITALMAEACVLIYEPADKIDAYIKKKADFSDFKLFRPPPTGDADFGAARERPVGAIAFCDRQRIFLVFRGTKFGWDWTYNLSAWVCNSPPRHAGFQRAWNELAPEIRAWLKPRIEAGGVLHLAGHSLGGAIATIAALEFAEQGIKVGNPGDTAGAGPSGPSLPVPIGSVVTLGSPRVGLCAFAKRYSQNPKLNAITHRHQHGIDFITRLMPPPIGFKHVTPAESLPACRLKERPIAKSGEERIDSSDNAAADGKIFLEPDDRSTQPSDLMAPSQNWLANAVAFLAAVVLAGFGRSNMQFLSFELGKFSAREYYAYLHHEGAIYATLLSPSHIFRDDWLNEDSKSSFPRGQAPRE